LSFTNKRSYEHCFKIPQPTNNVDLLFRMLHGHLEDFKSEHPIVAVFLEAQPAKSAHQQFGLFETALRDPNQLAETLARLTGLFGSERVGTPVLQETHRPDAFHVEPFSWQAEALDLNHRGRNEPMPSVALRRFRPGLSASVLLEENKPIQLRSGEITGTTLGQGPYVASGNWWDDKGWIRKEWDLHLCSGAVLRCHENADGWQVDGIYD
jgi:protein ImuB